MSTQEPDFVDESSDEMSDEMSKVYSKIADTAWNSAFAEMIV